MINSAPHLTPVTVLTGFLGSGKTTLLNHILRGEHGIRFGVLVNDFGEINIDARLVSSMDGQALDLANGCVCCTMQGDLVTSVRKMLARHQPPEHIIVEASGIADPLGIASAFRTPALRGQTRLDSILAVVDAENAVNPRFDEQLVQDQIRAADLVLLNKVDLVDTSARQARRTWLESIVPGMPIVETVRVAAPLEVLLGGRDQSRSDSMRTRAHPSHDVSTWNYRTDHPLAYRRVRSAMQQLGNGILRVKGILHLADAPNLCFAAHRVGRRVAIEVVGPWGEEPPGTQLVLLGEPGCLTEDDLIRLFDRCESEAFPLMQPENFARQKQQVLSKRLTGAFQLEDLGLRPGD